MMNAQGFRGIVATLVLSGCVATCLPLSFSMGNYGLPGWQDRAQDPQAASSSPELVTKETSASINAPTPDDETVSIDELKLVRSFEKRRITAIKQVIGSVIAIYDDDRQGGGSGVIIHPSGIALTNHHVIMGAGIKGWGGLADGQLYRWKLIGTDPGGDVSIIQMQGRDDFPFTPLGDSDEVRVGDWALAMGNPFILTEDQSPTVTLGIVSGVKRYQPGAGQNQLVYGNCIQVDSSINPGNSGGPLFNFDGRVIGINGRGSFKARGRVNVGLGYAISSNQIKNFIPDLLATKLVEHATLDANFDDRDGKVVCARRNTESPIAQAGLELGDQLLEFENIPILSANQYTNLICTLPENWPMKLKIRKKDGAEKIIYTRAIGLPYAKPGPVRGKPEGKTPEEKKKMQRQMDMIKLLSAKSGTVRFRETNRIYANQIWSQLADTFRADAPDEVSVEVSSELLRNGEPIGQQRLTLHRDGEFLLKQTIGKTENVFQYQGGTFFKTVANGESEELSLIEAKLEPAILYSLVVSAGFASRPMSNFGAPLIDGSGKALDQNAYRMKLVDVEGDPFFVWVDMYGEDGLPAHRLLKVSAGRNCDDNGVVFDEWTDAAGIILPKVCRVVTGLAERTVMEMRLTGSNWVQAPKKEERGYVGENGQRGDKS